MDRLMDAPALSHEMHVQKEFMSGSWIAPWLQWWRTEGWMMDEDVRLHINHQISALLYLMFYGNQSPL